MMRPVVFWFVFMLRGISPTIAQPIPENDVASYMFDASGALNGELKKWHKVTLGFVGPDTSETNVTNPFTDYRLDVTFTHSSTQKSYLVPGYYACDGNSANSGANSGSAWLVHFAPDEVGMWEWEASFWQGTNVSQTDDPSVEGTPGLYFAGTADSFWIDPTDKTGRDHRGKGRLQYVQEHHLRYAETGQWFLKAGSDAPENFLETADFDNTDNETGRLKTWGPHLRDFNPYNGDPTWAGGKGKGIIGAINYLSNKGMRSFSMLTFNLGGDSPGVFPYISKNDTDWLRMDCSKLAQWEVVFEHADKIGLMMHFKTQEQEMDQFLDGGALGPERKLYLRELIARFSHHLALHWNLGEQNSNTPEEREAFSNFIKKIDPYKHPVVSHSFSKPEDQEEIYGPLLGLKTFDGASLSIEPEVVHDTTLKWLEQSAALDHKWIVSNDEQNPGSTGVAPDSDDPSHDVIRKNALWGNLMAGGGGVEIYFGSQYDCNDLNCQDYRSRSNMWDQCRFALQFFDEHSIPFWNMTNADMLLSNGNWCFAGDDHILVYLRDGGTAEIDLSGQVDEDPYNVQWFDPRNGGPLHFGSQLMVQAAEAQQLGLAPFDVDLDWVVLLTKCNGCRNSDNDSKNESGLIAAVSTLAVLLAITVLVAALGWWKQKHQALQFNDTSNGDQSHLSPSRSILTSHMDEATGRANSNHSFRVATDHSAVQAIRVYSDENQSESNLVEFKDQVREHRKSRRSEQDSIPSTPFISKNQSEPHVVEFKDQVREHRNSAGGSSELLLAHPTQLDAQISAQNQPSKDEVQSMLDQDRTRPVVIDKPLSPGLPSKSFIAGQHVQI